MDNLQPIPTISQELEIQIKKCVENKIKIKEGIIETKQICNTVYKELCDKFKNKN